MFKTARDGGGTCLVSGVRITREPMPWPLLAVLAVQTALSVSMVRARTAFGDEALYLNAGHLEWAHWLPGTQIPDYQTWFSGAPVIYPPIGAIADSLGGLTAARLLSLVFMLGVTSLVWCTATRLLRDERAAFLSSWPDAGWQVALRRAAFLAGIAAAVLAVLLALGGPGYLTGIRVTTTGRVHGAVAASLVFAEAWSWTAVVLVPAVGAVVLCAVRRRWPQSLLLAVLALSALLAPADQARIQTGTSLNKHVDFGAWFAAIAAGYLLSSLPRRRLVLAVSLAAIIPVTSMGMAQARDMIDWPDVTGLVKVVRPLTAHGGHFLVETTDVLQYYLPNTSWRQWSNTQISNPEYYRQAIARHYFSVIVLGFNQTPAMDYVIGLDLSSIGGYRLVAEVPAGNTVFYVWEYLGRV